MSASVRFDRDHGVATGTPPKGSSRSTDVQDVNWKNSDVESDTFQSRPIVDGNNSYVNWIFARFSGTYTSISNIKFGHTAGVLPFGVKLFGAPDCTNDATALPYTTPTPSTKAELVDFTEVLPISYGKSVCVGATDPGATGKASSTTSNPAYTNYLPTQLRLDGAQSGDLPSITVTLQYDES